MSQGNVAGGPLASFTNAMATVAQLSASSSSLDGVPVDLENSIRFRATSLMQSAGILLRLPQDIIATGIVLFTRFWVGPEGGSLRIYDAETVAAAALYLAAKPSAHPMSPRSVIYVFAYLDAYHDTLREAGLVQAKAQADRGAAQAEAEMDEDEQEEERRRSTLVVDEEKYYVSEGRLQILRQALTRHESILLRTLGFQTRVVLPYTLCINYLQALGLFSQAHGSQDSQNGDMEKQSRGTRVAQRAIAHLNTLLLSPQLVYLTHQPPTLATAAIYLAAREEGVSIPTDEPWWEVFDTEREDLGFLVVAMLSMQPFAEHELVTWKTKRVPLTVGEVEAELELRKKSADSPQDQNRNENRNQDHDIDRDER